MERRGPVSGVRCCQQKEKAPWRCTQPDTTTRRHGDCSVHLLGQSPSSFPVLEGQGDAPSVTILSSLSLGQLCVLRTHTRMTVPSSPYTGAGLSHILVHMEGKERHSGTPQEGQELLDCRSHEGAGRGGSDIPRRASHPEPVCPFLGPFLFHSQAQALPTAPSPLLTRGDHAPHAPQMEEGTGSYGVQLPAAPQGRPVEVLLSEG